MKPLVVGEVIGEHSKAEGHSASRKSRDAVWDELAKEGGREGGNRDAPVAEMLQITSRAASGGAPKPRRSRAYGAHVDPHLLPPLSVLLTSRPT